MQNQHAHVLPDFRNLGVMLRVLLLVNGGALAIALARNQRLAELSQEIVELAALIEPPLLLCLLLVYIAQPLLRTWRYLVAACVVVAVAGLAAQVVTGILQPVDPVPPARTLLWSILAAAVVLAYLDLRGRAFSPAVTEARLMALTARIRPHFLFNSLNAVLGVIRSDPRRAEAALEELCELFRVLMAENRELVAFNDELALCRQYLDIERLRLGERLQINWDIKSCPPDALVPPLMLQPLLENAVYHGIEPSVGPGEIGIHITRHRDEVLITLTNPFHGDKEAQPGNRMAMANIRERLMLFFDLEARLDTDVRDGVYRVRIRLPYRRKAA
jgi:two-component system sensor histidine kinase AlgZ